MSLLLSNKRRKTVSGGVVTDPYASSVILYLKGDGADGSTSIIDSSPSPKTITRNGDTKISTAQSKYGGSSIYFDGTGDYLSLSLGTDAFSIRTDFWTIETWARFTANTGTILGSSDGVIYLMLNIGANFLVGDSIINNINIGNPIVVNSWKHYALSFDGTTYRFYFNGILTGSSTSLLRVYTLNNILIGRRSTDSPTGYFDSFRITKGIARYTANFNPETDTYLN